MSTSAATGQDACWPHSVAAASPSCGGRRRELHVTPTMVAAKDTAALVTKLHQLSGNALVVAHGDTIPNILKALGINRPINIPDADYSELFIIILGDKPQLFRPHYPDDAGI